MKKPILNFITGLTLIVVPALAQSISITPTGVDMGNTTPGIAGTLLQQSGQTTTISTQDGTTSTVRLTVLPNGNVGIGTATPAEELSVSGNATVTGSATVGSLKVGSSQILTVGSFESSEQSLPSAGNSISVSHGLGGLPKFTTVSLRCISPEWGWLAGDEISLSSLHMDGNSYGCTTAVNATAFKLKLRGGMTIHRMDGNDKVAIDVTKWKLVFRAWR